MSSKFRPLAEGYFVSPQITADEVRAAATMGIKLIINNRPEGEEPDQPPGAEIEKAAKAEGVAYVAIPIRGSDISATQLEAFERAAAGASGPVLAFCRSGTRSTMIRAFALARAGGDADEILEEAAAAGYDLSPLRPRLVALANR